MVDVDNSRQSTSLEYPPSSQFSPVKPCLQSHENPPGLLSHVPPFLQGIASHSLISRMC